MKYNLLFFILVLTIACGSKKLKEIQRQQPKSDQKEKRAVLHDYLKQYQPYEMAFDASGYNETDKTILKKLVEAAKYVDTIYWQQTSKIWFETSR